MLTQDLVKLNNLQLAGKLVSDERLLGIRASKRVGVGTEFEQYRHYEPGHDPKRIDWKLFARTEQYLVRESATESNQQIKFLLDLSGSMNYAENNISRLDYARILLASLAYLGHRQGDQLALYGLTDRGLQALVLPDKQSGPSARFQKILAALSTAEATGAWQQQPAALPEFSRKQTEMLIIASDFLQVDDEWLSLIRAVAGPRREVVIFQILGDQELDFTLTGFYRFRDLETGQQIEVQAEAVRDHVRASATTYFAHLDASLRLPHVRLIRVRLSDPMAEVLADFLTGTRHG